MSRHPDIRYRMPDIRHEASEKKALTLQRHESSRDGWWWDQSTYNTPTSKLRWTVRIRVHLIHQQAIGDGWWWDQSTYNTPTSKLRWTVRIRVHVIHQQAIGDGWWWDESTHYVIHSFMHASIHSSIHPSIRSVAVNSCFLL